MFTPLKNLPNGRNWTLNELNDREMQLLIPVTVFLSICMVVGIIGNTLVLYINIVSLKRHRSTHRCFITFLAFVDVSFCMIGDPFMLWNVTHPYIFTNTLACKILRAFTYFNAMASVLVLVVIALDRYLKICRPHGFQFTFQSMRYMFAIIAGACFIFSIPCFMLYGKSTVQTGITNITGIQCFPDDMHRDTMFAHFYNIFICTVFIILTASMSVFYMLVWRQIRKHSHPVTSNVASNALDTQPYSCSSESCSTKISFDEVRTSPKPHQSKLQGSERTDDPKQYTNKGNSGVMNTKNNERAKTIRVSKILFVVTAFFVLSFTPFISLELLTFFDNEFINNLDNLNTMLYQFFWRTFAINFMINPFIYGVMDRKFQTECKKLALNFYRNFILRRNL